MSNSRLSIQGHTHMISAGHPLATQVGYAILESGGNAVDAGVASAMVLGVVQSDLVNFAGVAPIIIRQPRTGAVTSISGLGRWPRAADLKFLEQRHNGHVPDGVLRTIVPGAPDAYITALERFGTMTFGEVAAGAIQIARDGFIMHTLMSQTISENLQSYERWPSSRSIYLPKGRAPVVGENFVQTDLAECLQYMVDEEKAAKSNRISGLKAARNAFYRGDIAKAIVDFNQENDGWLSLADMSEFRVGVEPPITVKHRGVTLHTCGPWCQGPSLAQMWSFLDGIELKDLGHNSTEYIHLLTEIMKIVFADREIYFGDPEFVDVPLDRLLSVEYATTRKSLIQKSNVLCGAELWNGISDAPSQQSLSQDTSYTCAVDSSGLAISITPSDGSASSPVIPGWGIIASPRGSQSWAKTGHPSSVAPWKRPRLTPNPAIAETEAGSIMPFGTPGADVQCQAMLQVLLNITEFGMSPQQAVEQPRFATYSFPESFEPHTALPDVLRIESRIPIHTREGLCQKGHNIQDWPDFIWKAGAVCVVLYEPNKPLFSGGADPRRPCMALGR